MIRHIVMWNYANGFSEDENIENARKVKNGLEALADLDGVLEMKVRINELPYSNTDVLLDSLFESEDAFKSYKVHQRHLQMAELIGKVLQNRVCFDYVC